MPTKNVIDGEVVKDMSVVDTPKSVNITPNQLKKQMIRDQDMRAVIDEYIAKNMVSGKDYGSIEIKGKLSKPSLFKPGAEKFCSLFKIRPTFKKDVETLDMLGNTPGIIGYICELVDSRGRVMGEGRGTAKTDPKSDDFNINKQVKIAEKRAQIDAVLRTGGLSDFFTQDMEDAPKDGGSNTSSDKSTAPATGKQKAFISRLLLDRGVDHEGQVAYMEDEYGITLPLTMETASYLIGELKG